MKIYAVLNVKGPRTRVAIGYFTNPDIAAVAAAQCETYVVEELDVDTSTSVEDYELALRIAKLKRSLSPEDLELLQSRGVGI
jgi:hypothetical protein